MTIQQDVIGSSKDVTVIYRPDPSKNLTVDKVQQTMTSLGRTKAQVAIIDDTVVIRTLPLDLPKPVPSPSPSTTPSPGASPSGTAPSSPSPSPTGPVIEPSQSAGGSAAAAAAAAPSSKPTKKAGGNQASPTPSAQPSPKPSPTTEPSPSTAPSATPTPSPTPTGPPTPKEILAALGKQAGVGGEDILVHPLDQDTQDALVAALAERAGTQPSGVVVKDVGGDERARLLADLANQAGIQTDDIVINDVGPTWGAQISKKALQGLIIFLVLVTLYISFRFEWKMAVSALTALLHDLIITAGIYALVGREVTPETVIAILTILGYSLYDTVVIFDRIKENTESLALVARDGYSGVVNLSLNETLMRSVNTSLVVLLPITSLLLFGGDTLKDFAFALFIGVAAGAYSSIFIASPMLALLKEREPRYAQMRLRAARAASRGQPQAATVGGSGAARPSRTTSASSGRRPASTAKPPPAATTASTSGVSADGDGDGTTPTPAAKSGSASGSGGRPPGARPSGSRSKSKKRTPPAKRRRR